MKSSGYQGHPSWNAWNVSLWIANDEQLYNSALECVRSNRTRKAAALELIGLISEATGQKTPATPDGAPYAVTNVIRAMNEEYFVETEIHLPDYPQPCYVTGVKTQRNPPGRPYLTLAVGTWAIRHGGERKPISDIVTRMRLADAASHLHTLPVNKPAWYGPNGRRGPVGRGV